MRKFLSMLLVIMMIFTLFTGCSGSENQETSETSDASEEESSDVSQEGDEEDSDHLMGEDGVYYTGTPIVDEEVTINVLTSKASQDLGTDINEDKWAIKTAIAETNVNIDWTEVTSGTLDEKLSVQLAGGDLPDVYFYALDSTDILQYEDYFYPIEDLFDTYAQNIYAAMSQIEGWETMAYTPSGHVYSGFGFYQSLKENSMTGIQIINTRWLENVGMEMPEDWDSYYEVLEAFRDQDANGNGNDSDEIPYGWAYNMWCAELFNNESGRFGIPTYNKRHNAGGYVYVDEEGTVHGSRTGEDYYTYLTVMSQMYADGLIDPEGFSDAWDEMSNKVKNDLIGTYFSWTALEYLESDEEWETMTRFGYTGYEDNYYQNGVVDLTTASQLIWVVTNDCENPNAAVRFWDYLQSSQELSQAMALGEKGILWDEYEDGSGYYFIVPSGDDLDDGMSFENMKYTYGFVNGCPLILAEDTPVNDASQSVDAALRDEMVDVVSDAAIPESQSLMSTYASIEAAEELALYSTDLLNYVETFHSDSIVNGVTEASYAEYEEGLESYRYSDYIEYYQHYYDADWD